MYVSSIRVEGQLDLTLKPAYADILALFLKHRNAQLLSLMRSFLSHQTIMDYQALLTS